MSGTSRQPREKAFLALYRQTVFPVRLVALGWVAGAAAWLPPARLRVRVLAAYDRWKARASRRWWWMQVLALLVMTAGLALTASSIWESVMTQGPTSTDSNRTAPVAASVLPLDVGQPSMPTRHSQVSAEIPEVSRTVEKPRKLPNTRAKPGNTRAAAKRKRKRHEPYIVISFRIPVFSCLFVKACHFGGRIRYHFC